MHKLLLVACLVAAPVFAQDGGVALIPRNLLFGNPEKTRPTVSPDGKSLAWLAPDEKNVLQVWVNDAIVTADKKRGIRNFSWSEDSKSILYGQDADGDENFHVFQVELATKNVRDLTPWQGVRAGILATSNKQPNVLLVTANVRDRKFHDVYRVHLDTGAATLDTQNPGDVNGWGVDAQFNVRAAIATTKEGGTEIRVRETVKAPWKALVTVGLEENVEFIDFTEDGKSVVLNTSINSDTQRLVEKNLKSGAERLLASSDKSDVSDVIGYPSKRGVRAASIDVNGRNVWVATEPSMKSELEAIDAAIAGDFWVVSMDAADTRWILVESRDNGPQRFWNWDRKAKKAEVLFTAQPKLEGLPLAEMKPVNITARDGLVLPSYLTLPVGKAAKNLPMVLLVHGGPWGRDMWGYHPTVQWLANRGYAVLQANFRASTGFGKKFLNAGNRQWGLAMHDDLIDAVNWAVKEGVADPKQVAIMGGSYGGYATLAGLAFTPEQFKCGVDIVGPSNLFTLMSTIPPYWAAFKAQMIKRMGDPDNAADKELLTRASPLFSASKIKVPLLIGQGANDPRVKVAESEQIVSAMEKNGLPVTYVVYPDEGHGFARPENRIDFYARSEEFLAKCLGGRAEPLTKIEGATAQVKVVAKKK
ncbi:MAG: S9 family peptidase [Archangium gephyra]|uniref:S9 family peptidase n=1 Tax=Archangium gephyra TaxID=48 RepID=A0A2W5SSG8_9BACT|nr:MAG: S9 family peptidase [Archangium gephyra]